MASEGAFSMRPPERDHERVDDVPNDRKTYEYMLPIRSRKLDSCKRRSSTLLPAPKRLKVKEEEEEEPFRPAHMISFPGRFREQGQPFRLLDSLCGNSDVILMIATEYLEPNDFLKLYCISKLFHYSVNCHQITYLASSARNWIHLEENETADRAKNMQRVRDNHLQMLRLFPLTAYRHLRFVRCDGDSKVGHPSVGLVPAAAMTHIGIGEKVEDGIPCLKFLGFLHHRAKAIRIIIARLYYDHGFRLPLSMPLILCKLWATMDMPYNMVRIGMIHNRSLWTNGDLYNITLFFLKLDMAFNDPVDGRGKNSLRKLMMAQKGLTVLAKTLARQECRTELDIRRLDIKLKYRPNARNRGYGFMGVPAGEMGELCQEGWGKVWPGQLTPAIGPPLGVSPKKQSRLMRLDELIMREAARRRLGLHHFYKNMVMSGYVNHFNDKKSQIPNKPVRRSLRLEARERSGPEIGPMMAALARGCMICFFTMYSLDEFSAADLADASDTYSDEQNSAGESGDEYDE